MKDERFGRMRGCSLIPEFTDADHVKWGTREHSFDGCTSSNLVGDVVLR